MAAVMRVSLNTNYNNIKSVNFGENCIDSKIKSQYTDKEIKMAKVKKVVSECSTVCLGIGILYFAMKRNFKFNRIKNIDKKIQETKKLVLPNLKMKISSIDQSI